MIGILFTIKKTKKHTKMTCITKKHNNRGDTTYPDLTFTND